MLFVDETKVIKFKAQVSKVQTLADGGIRVTLDLSENDIKQAGELMRVKQAGAILEVVAVPVLVDPLVAQMKEHDLSQ
jgi:hypothetical protein